MLSTVKAGDFTISGISLGGVYTSLYIHELDAMLDVGVAPRHFAAAKHLFISHAHADHFGAIGTFMGIRGLHRFGPPRVYMPREIEAGVGTALQALAGLQRYDYVIEPVPLGPGDEAPISRDRFVRAFRTHHPVPSLGYQFLRRVQKLKPEYLPLPGPEIGRLRTAGADIFEMKEQLEIAYATDTLVRVLDTNPSMLQSRVLILECSFLDERKTLEAARAGCHIHLDELLERADTFENEHLVLMHFSQLYTPAEVHEILARRCPAALHDRIRVLAPTTNHWPG